MDRNKKIILLSIVGIGIVLLIILGTVGYIRTVKIQKNKKAQKENITETLPEIKEDFSLVTFNEKYISQGKIYYDENTKDIIEITNEKEVFLGNNGSLYPNPIEKIIEMKNEPIYSIKNIKIYSEYDKDLKQNIMYYISDNSKKSETYNYIEPICIKSNNSTICNYLILEDKISNEKYAYYLLNLINDKKIKLNENIQKIENIKNESCKDIILEEFDYLVVYAKVNNKLKAGLINYEGVQVLDFKYDNLYTYKNGIFIAEENKKYGIIDSRDNILLEIDYDGINYTNNYFITLRNNYIDVFNVNLKSVLKDDISITNKKEFNYCNNKIYSYIESNNNLYLGVENDKSYIINKKGIEKNIPGNINYLYDKNNEIKFYYTTSIEEGKLTTTFYDQDLYEYYKITKDTKLETTKNIKIYNIKNDYYIIETPNNKYYIDLFNSKETTEKEVFIKYLDNGYSFTILNDILTIYKDKKILHTEENITEYLGGYLFANNEKIFEIEFKK